MDQNIIQQSTLYGNSLTEEPLRWAWGQKIHISAAQLRYFCGLMSHPFCMLYVSTPCISPTACVNCSMSLLHSMPLSTAPLQLHLMNISLIMPPGRVALRPRGSATSQAPEPLFGAVGVRNRGVPHV